MPPEVVNGQDIKSSPAIDVWGIGILMYQLYFGKTPF